MPSNAHLLVLRLLLIAFPLFLGLSEWVQQGSS